MRAGKHAKHQHAACSYAHMHHPLLTDCINHSMLLCAPSCTTHCSQIVEGNPCMEYVRMIAMPWFNKLDVKRAENNGGDKTYTSMEDLEADYTNGALHPGGSRSSRPAVEVCLGACLCVFVGVRAPLALNSFQALNSMLRHGVCLLKFPI